MASIIETQREVAVTDLDVDAVMHAICERTQELTRADSATILMLEGEELVIRRRHRLHGGQDRESAHRQGDVPRLGLRTRRVGDPGRRAGGSAIRPAGPASSGCARRRRAAPSPREDGRTADRHLARAGLLRRTTISRRSSCLSVVLSSALSHAAEFESKRQQVEALARFETIYQGAAIGIALMSPEGGFLDANPAFELMFGYTKAELRTMTLRDYTHPDDIERNEKLFREMMDGTHDTYEMEKRFCRKDGQLVWGHVAAALQRGADGEPQYAISMVENITERKEAERADRLPGVPRRAHGAGEPLAVPGGARERHRPCAPARPGRRRHLHGSGQLQARERQPGARRRRRPARPAVRDVSWRSPGRPTWWRDRAATSSCCCSSDLDSGPAILPGTEAALLVGRVGRPAGCTSSSRSRSRSKAWSSRSRRRSGSASSPATPSTRSRCCSHADVAMYRSKKIGPGGSVVFSTDRGRSDAPAPSDHAASARRSRTRAGCCTTSPSSISRTAAS